MVSARTIRAATLIVPQKTPVADLEGGSGGSFEPPIRPNYFSFMGKFTKNQNLNGLLVTGQIGNTSPGGGVGGWGGGAPGGKLVPGSHKRCELGHTVIRHFSRGDQRIREVIPVLDSLWKETTFVCFFAS